MPASAQAQKPAAPNLKAIPAAELKAMDTCVSGVLARLQQERASYRAVKPAVGQECDAQLRAVLAAAIRVGQAGPCTTVDGCIDMARRTLARVAFEGSVGQLDRCSSIDLSANG